MGARDTHLWHPFAAMGKARRDHLVIERGDDVWVWDTDGNRYLDGTASLWYANVGHGRPEIADAVAEQMRTLEAYSTFTDLANPPALALAERLASAAPLDGGRVFLGTGGGEGVETAAKLARRFWSERGAPERTHLISRTAAYHGSHGYGTALGGIEPNRQGHGPLLADAVQVPHDSVDALAAELERIGPDRVAAFFVEPVIGAGGVHPPADGYIEGVAELCRQAGVLLVVDSVICAFGRLGTWFGIERWGVEPDMIVFAKGVTSGYVPLGGVIVSDRVAEPFWAPDGPPFRHGPTYAGHPTCCAAALANLDLLERDGLLRRGQELEGELLEALLPLADHPLVAEVRGGVGLLAAVELAPDLLEEMLQASIEVYRLVREHGVLVRPLLSAVAVSPPLTATPQHFELLTEGLSKGLDRLAAVSGRAVAGAAG
jgi:putrescine---pyruvate transaminase